MSVTAIIVNYYTASLLPRLIFDDLAAAPEVSQIIVVDNSQELQKDAFGMCHQKKVLVIINEVNRGFGAAVNQAIECATGDWILLVNPDVRISQKSIHRLLDASIRYHCPLVGPRFYWDEKHLFKLPPAPGNCLWFDFANVSANKIPIDAEILSFYWILRHERFWNAEDSFYEPFLSGACLLVDRNWISSLGGMLFDERFFLYFEDTDLCVQALYNKIRPLCVPEASVVHYYNQSPSIGKSKLRFMEESQKRFWAKHYHSFSMPDLDKNSYSYPNIDMGDRNTNPVFEIPESCLQEKNYLEIGINPYFVPFAQALLDDTKFYFPSEIWQRLTSGQYYTRIRGAASGTKKMWMWKKGNKLSGGF